MIRRRSVRAMVAAEAVDFPGTNVGVPLPLPADFPPTVIPTVVSKAEGDSGSDAFDVRVTLSHSSVLPVTVEWTTWFAPGLDENQADPATDYTPAIGVAVFAPGETATTVPVPVHGDTLVEGDEYVIVSFHNPTNARMGGFWGLGIAGITNDD